MTINDVAEHLEVSWDIVKDIQKEQLRRHYSRPRLKDVRQIAIDEFYIGRGHRYLTARTGADPPCGEMNTPTGFGQPALSRNCRRRRATSNTEESQFSRSPKGCDLHGAPEKLRFSGPEAALDA